MSRSTTHRSSDVEFNQKLLYEVAGGVVSVNGTAKFIRWVAPCDGTIRACYWTPTVTATNAAARLRVGSAASPTALLNDYVLTNVTTGGDIIGSFTAVALTRGTAYQCSMVNADTTGEVDVIIIVEPA